MNTTTKFNPATASEAEIKARIDAYTVKADSMEREDCDSPLEQKQIRNLRVCVQALRAELAKRAANATA